MITERCEVIAMDWLWANPLTTLIILLLGVGVFVRLVAKEKHRRDKHLLARLQAKAAEANEHPA